MPDDNPSSGAGVHPYTVAIPARDEADLIGAALGALAEQEDAPPFAVVLLLNNCIDATASVVRELAPSLPYPVHVFEVALEGRHANAAWARRLAMSAASQLTMPSGFVLTSDADSRADKRWLASMVECFDRGARALPTISISSTGPRRRSMPHSWSGTCRCASARWSSSTASS